MTRDATSPATRRTPTSRGLPTGAALAAVVAALLAACSGSSNDNQDSVVVQGDVPIVYAKRSTSISINPTDGTPSADGGDLMLREKSSPSAKEHNLTAQYTQGRGDASDPEVSYDGKKVVFAMRCPSGNTATVADANGAQVAACTGRWNIWEYDMTGTSLAGGSFRRLSGDGINGGANAGTGDDVDPAYLPAGQGFVFSSNRQAKSSRNQALGRAYKALDEYEREAVLNLHTMDAKGGNIQQITFNQSHDRNPVVRANGDLMFARWEHVADRNRFAIFRSKPDGTDMFVLYGAHSPGNSYLHPRETDPNGRYKGYLTSSLMSLSGTQEGGSLQFIDATNYSEYGTPANTSVPAQGGQREGTDKTLNQGRGLSEFGRVSTPYPLWDGTDRILLAYRPCEVTRNGNVVPCVTLTAEERALLSDNMRTRAQRALDPVQDNAPAAYAIYMFDPSNNTWLNVAAPPPGFMYTDPVALQARTEPNATQPTTVDSALAARDMALIEVRSVYDTDGLNRMAEQMFVAGDKPAGCSVGIAMKTAVPDHTETRAMTADLVKMKDAADPAYHCTPVRFVRAVRAVAPPAGMGTREVIGETEFEQQQILGYAAVEPDGSFKLQVPADVPLGLQIVDGQGRAFQTHTNWIQVRPGERRTCDGCHSPRRGAALNSGAVVNNMPASLKASLASQHQQGETMASLRTRLDPNVLTLQRDPVFTDEWADTTKQGVTARQSIELKYTGNANAADDLTTAVPVNGVINYPEHIQPLWTKARGTNGANTCTNCHTDPLKLDLRGSIAGTGRIVSYEELALGDPVLDANGQPVTRLVEGVPEVVRGPALINTSSGANSSAGQARKSRLTEIMSGETLLVDAASRTAHPAPPATAPNHATMLNKAEKRLLAEWMDLGGQYYNDPFNTTGGVRAIRGLSQETFRTSVLPVLQANCVGCHMPGMGFQRNRFILTGNAEGDYNVSLTMVNNACLATANALLARPSAIPHPNGALGQTTAVLPAGSAGYQAIANWIASGCN
jgi:hypothetical protein